MPHVLHGLRMHFARGRLLLLLLLLLTVQVLLLLTKTGLPTLLLAGLQTVLVLLPSLAIPTCGSCSSLPSVMQITTMLVFIPAVRASVMHAGVMLISAVCVGAMCVSAMLVEGGMLALGPSMRAAGCK
jgi:hypothetical protein